VRKGDEPPQSHRLHGHPGRAGSPAWPRTLTGSLGPGSEGTAGWDEVLGARGLAGSLKCRVQKRPSLDLLGQKETEGND